MSALAAQTGALNLGQGFPDRDGPPEIAQAAIDAIAAGVNQYPPVNGIDELRHAIAEHQARFWGQTLDPMTDIVVTAGATEALASAFLALCEQGDEVIVFDPTYDSYAAGAALAGARLRTVTLHPPDAAHPDRFWFDSSELARAFNDRTRFILVNTPHNPTGKVFTDAELTEIATLCQRHDVLAVTDEVYEHLVFRGTHRPLATLDGMAERTITISSGGKTFSFTGWKIGWAAGPAALITAIRTAKQFLTFVNGAPFQPAIAAGLRLSDEYFETFRISHEAKADLLTDALATAGFTVLRPEGTYFISADISPLGFTDSVAFCLSLPETARVVAIPSSVFYQGTGTPPPHIRFCFAKTDATLREAGDRLVTAFGR